jgi:hypothetical protein
MNIRSLANEYVNYTHLSCLSPYSSMERVAFGTLVAALFALLPARHSGGMARNVSKSLDVCARFFQERVARGLGYSLENSLKSFTFSGRVAAIFMVRLPQAP